MPIVAGNVSRCRTVTCSSFAVVAVTVTVPSVTVESGLTGGGVCCATRAAGIDMMAAARTLIVVCIRSLDDAPRGNGGGARFRQGGAEQSAQATGGPLANGRSCGRGATTTTAGA